MPTDAVRLDPFQNIVNVSWESLPVSVQFLFALGSLPVANMLVTAPGVHDNFPLTGVGIEFPTPKYKMLDLGANEIIFTFSPINELGFVPTAGAFSLMFVGEEEVAHANTDNDSEIFNPANGHPLFNTVATCTVNFAQRTMVWEFTPPDPGGGGGGGGG